MWFNKLFKRKSKKKDWFKTHPDVRIVPAFEFDGIVYYEFEDPNNLSLGRGGAAQVVLKELSMSVTSPFLRAHTEAVKGILSSKSIDIFKINELNKQLAERNELIIDTITPLKASAVIYFDETENPYSFDYKYAFEKIERWKKSENLNFFFQTPLKKLIPSLDWSEETLENYLKIASQIDQTHYQTVLDVLSQVLSEKEKNSEWLKLLKLERNII